MAMPAAPKKRGVPAYMVSFGDMVTLLLTFFILLVALADTQEAGLVGAGRGPIVRHVLAKGQPGIMSGRLIEHRQRFKRDAWWIPSQEGDPDELEEVRDKLDQELLVRFRPDEASINYERDRLVLRLPARVRFVAGRPVLDEALAETMTLVAERLRRDPSRRVRISGDVPATILEMEWTESARLGRLVYQRLASLGVHPHQMSLWGWGANRPRLPGSPGDERNRGLTIEIMDAPGSRRGGG